MARMKEDEFGPKTRDTIGRRAGFRCSNPDCRILTIGPGSLPDSVVDTGVAAHITAASLGGARYRSDITPRQRSSASNGVWLCQTHAKEIDNDPGRYTEEVLRGWQANAMKLAAEEFGASRLASAIRAEVRGAITPKAEYIPGTSRGQSNDKIAILVKNTGAEVIDRFFLEVKIPKGLIENPYSYSQSHKRDRSTAHFDFFLIDPGNRIKLYPGAETEICSFLIGSEKSGPGGLLAQAAFFPAGGAPARTDVTRDGPPA